MRNRVVCALLLLGFASSCNSGHSFGSPGGAGGAMSGAGGNGAQDAGGTADGGVNQAGANQAGAAAQSGGAGGNGTIGTGGDNAGQAGTGGQTESVREPSVLGLLAGKIGGCGLADDVGKDARFDDTLSLAFDGASSVYVPGLADNIRKVDVLSGAVTTLPMPGVGEIVAIVSDAVIRGVGGRPASNLYIVAADATIRKVSLGSGAVTLIAGSSGMRGSADGIGANARFALSAFKWVGIALDNSGNLYVSDGDNDTIRQIELATNKVTTLAGAVGVPGNVDGDRATARFDLPAGLAWDANAQSLLVADRFNSAIRSIDLSSSTGKVSTIGSTYSPTTGGDQVYGIVATESNVQYYTTISGVGRDFAGSTSLIAGGTRGPIVDGTGSAASFASPLGIAFDGVNSLFVVDSCTIRKVTISGVTTTLAGSPTPPVGSGDGIGSDASFYQPGGVAADRDGNVLVADTRNQTIRRILVGTGAVSTFAGYPGALGSVDGIGGAARFHMQYKGLYPGAGLASDGLSQLFIADSQNRIVRQIDLTSANVTTIAGKANTQGQSDGTGAAASFAWPLGVAFDGGQHVFIADAVNETLRALDVVTHSVTTLAGEPGVSGSSDGLGPTAHFSFAGCQAMAGVAADSTGNVYLADCGNNTIRKIDAASGAVSTLAGDPTMAGSSDGTGSGALFKAPAGLALDGDTLYVADFGNSTLRKIAVATGEVTTLVGVAGRYGVKVGALPGRLNRPVGVAVLPDHSLVITDEENVVLTVR